MNSGIASTLDPLNVSVRLGMCAAALAGTAAIATDAEAAIVTFNTPISVPNTFAGVYINLLTGASAITPAAVPGWDFGPWGSANTLSFFFPGTPASSHGAVAASTTGPYLDLLEDSVISAASTFSAVAATAATAAFQSTGSHIMGFRFFNESTAAVNYGYLEMETTGPLGFPARVTRWSFDNSGAAITVPSAPPPPPAVVSEPSTALLVSMSALALGAVNLRRMRRQRRTLAS